MQRHLATFESRPHAHTGPRTLPLCAPGGRFAMPRTHSLSDSLRTLVGSRRRAQCSNVCCHNSLTYPSLPCGVSLHAGEKFRSLANQFPAASGAEGSAAVSAAEVSA